MCLLPGKVVIMKKKEIFSTLGEYAALKIKEHEKKEQQIQQAQRNRQAVETAKNLAAYLQPHIAKIIQSNIYFDNVKEVNLSCSYDPVNFLYRVQAQLIINSERRLDRAMIAVSLRQSITQYFFSLHADMVEESLDLQTLSAKGWLTPAEMYSFSRRYDILNHQLKLKGIEYDPKNPLLVNVWFGFRW